MFWKAHCHSAGTFEQPPLFEVRTIAMIEELMTDIFRSEPLLSQTISSQAKSPPVTNSFWTASTTNFTALPLRCRPVYECFESYFSRYFKRQAGMTFRNI